MNICLLSLIASSKRARCSALSSEFAGNKAGEVADLHRNFTERADDEAGNAPRVVGVHLCLDGPSCVRMRNEYCAELDGSFVVIFEYFFLWGVFFNSSTIEFSVVKSICFLNLSTTYIKTSVQKKKRHRPPSQRTIYEHRFGWSWSKPVYFAAFFHA